MSGSLFKKTLLLIIVLAFMTVANGLAILAGSGSTALSNILTQIASFSDLIALGVALGVMLSFMPSLKRKF